MTDQITLWQSAAELFAARSQAITTDDLNRPTPCEDFNVAELTEHATSTQRSFGVLLGADTADDADLATAIASFSLALGKPGSLDGEVEHPGLGSMPKTDLLAIATNDMLIHAWDLAQALGIDDALPQANIDAAIAGLRAFPAHVKEIVFSGAREPEADASPIDELLALAGRTRL